MSALQPNLDEPRLNEEHLSVLTTLSDDNPAAFIQDLLDSYTATWEERYAEIQSACESSDMEALRKAIHTLNGSSANVGFNRLCLYCRAVEGQIHEGTLSDTSGIPEHVKAEYDASLEELNAFLSKL